MRLKKPAGSGARSEARLARLSIVPEGSHRPDGLYLGATIWFVLTVLWLTWTPLQFSGEPNPISFFPGTSPFELVGNGLLMAPIGIVLAVSTRRSLGFVGAVCLLLSTCIEFGQIFLLGRIVSVTDVLLNTSGAVFAGWVARRLQPRFGAAGLTVATGLGVFAIVGSFTMIGGLWFKQELRIADWDADFPILVGVEADGDKLFEGTVSEAMICAGEVQDRFCASAGASDYPRERLARIAEASQVVEVFARFQSATEDQWGPTRIITFSSSSYDRNITLGQEGSALVLRIRTPLMGPNGRNFEIWIPRAIRAAEPMEVHARFDNGAVLTTIRDSRGTRTEHHTFDALSSGLMIRGVGAVTPLQIGWARLLASLNIAIPICLGAVGLYRRSIPGRGKGPGRA